MERGKGIGGLVIFLETYGTSIGVIVLIAIFSILKPQFFPTFDNAISILRDISLLCIIASGLTVVMIMTEFDLSIGALTSFAGVLAAGFTPKFGTIPGLLLVLLIGMGVGAINGVVVTVLGVTGFIATIGMMTLLIGLNYWYTGGIGLYEGIPDLFVWIGKGSLGPVPNLVIIMAAVLLILWTILTKTSLGRRMHSIGGNPEAARFSGISIMHNKIIGFVICGFCASLTGVLLASNLEYGHPTAGDAFLLDGFTVVFIGAVTGRTGQFHIAGTFIGALILGILFNGFAMLNLPYFIQLITRALVLIAAVAGSGIAKRSSKEV
jgi:ribose transport system permease protein